MITKREILECIAQNGHCSTCTNCPYNENSFTCKLIDEIIKLGAKEMLKSLPREFDKTKILTCVTADQAKVGQKGFFDCDKSDCEVLKMLKENEQLKQELKNTFIYNKKVVAGLVADKDYLKEKNDQLKRKISVMQSCYFNSCIGCNNKKCEVKE